MTFRVEITRRAAREVAQRYDDMAARSKPSADKWRDGLLDAVASLDQHPERCPQAPEAEWYGDGLRELFYGKRRSTYRVLFEVRGSVVYVLRVRHGRQDFLKPEGFPPPADS